MAELSSLLTEHDPAHIVQAKSKRTGEYAPVLLFQLQAEKFAVRIATEEAELTVAIDRRVATDIYVWFEKNLTSVEKEATK